MARTSAHPPVADFAAAAFAFLRSSGRMLDCQFGCTLTQGGHLEAIPYHTAPPVKCQEERNSAALDFHLEAELNLGGWNAALQAPVFARHLIENNADIRRRYAECA